MTRKQYDELLGLQKALEVLEKDDSLFNQFNLFETLGITNTEIRHSNVLGWLMNPTENHGFGCSFLKKLVNDFYDNGDYIFNIGNVDFNTFKIKREWKNIDLLAVSRKSKTVIVIENKIWSGESSHQLEKYQKIIDKEYLDYNKIFVFLSPFGTPPSNTDTWLIYDYERILDLINEVYDVNEVYLDEDIKVFVNHYINNLRRNIVGDKKLQELCVEIYNNHKKAFDLVLNNLPDNRAVYKDLLIEYLENRPEVLLDVSGKKLVRFTTKTLDEVLPNDGEGWTKTGRVFLFEIENFPEFLALKTVVGPSNTGSRQRMLDVIFACEDNSIFKDADPSKKIGRKWTHMNREFILDTPNSKDPKSTEVKEAIYETLDELFDSYIPKVEKYLTKSYNIDDRVVRR